MYENLVSHRQLRVFVSSTFNDMRAERSLLVGKVFPMVADYCHKRKVEFVGVDLRWGVSEEQSRRGETVAICMAEIDRSRPLFIGMVGQRYGWVPDGSPVSVTEQEMLYGALEAPEDTEAFFYLRDPALTEELCGPFEPDARLDDLKARIRGSGFPVMDGYRDLESFGRQVYADLTAMVDRLVLRAPERDPVAEAREDQFFLAERFCANMAPRPEPEAQLSAAINAGGLVLMSGEPGAGKTALLSNWALSHRDAEDVYPFLYYVGAAEDRGWEQLGRQLVCELQARFSLERLPVESREELRRAIHISLGQAAKRGRIVLAIDQVDALTLDDGFGMSWLPEALPQGVSAVLTLEEGDALERLCHRRHCRLQVERFSPDEVETAAVRYLADYSKTLSRRHLDMLRESERVRSPLFLITLLDEIRHIGRHDYLTDQLGEYLACKDQRALFEKVLQRIDREHDGPDGALPRRVLSLLEASDGGLTEAELLALLHDTPPMEFAALRLAIERFTVMRGGAICLAVPEFRAAVHAHYALNGEELARFCTELIDWFTAHPDTPRRNHVLPRLLRKAGQREALYQLLREPACFEELWGRSRVETKALWVFTEQDAAEGYRAVLDTPREYGGELRFHLAELLAELGRSDDAAKLLNTLVVREAGTEDGLRGMACGLLGNLYQRAGQLSAAEQLYRQKAACARRQGDRYEQQRALGNLGLAALMRNDLETAREAFENVLRLAEALNQRDAQQIALGNLGNIAFSLGETEKARALFQRQRVVSLDSGNTAGLINALGALAVLYTREKDFAAAEEAVAEQEALSRKVGSQEGLANALGNRGALAQARGEWELANTLFLKKLKLCRNSSQFLGEQNALGNLASLALARKMPETALEYTAQRVEVTHRNRAIRQYAEALAQLARAEKALGRDDDARLHRMQADAIAKQNGFSLPKEEKDTKEMNGEQGDEHS